MQFITQALNIISISLLIPVIVLLLAGMFYSLVSLGGFCSTYLALLQQRKQRKSIMNRLENNLPVDEAILGRGTFARHLRELDTLGWDEIHCEKRITDIYQVYDQELERAGFLMKMAPMLGLMGTLIPMGPALAGLASGDIGSMAYNMRIAFATTVVGCFVAGVGLLLYSTKKHWYADEIASLRYALDLHIRRADDVEEGNSK